MKKYLKTHIIEIILCIILVAGLCLILYPTVSDRWNSFRQTRVISSYKDDVENAGEEERQAMLEAARAYNEKLAGQIKAEFYLTEEEEAEYEALLDVSGTGIMGYVQIPLIDVYLPIYHGNDDATLQVAIGHIPGSSLPIGGPSTHTVISGHRGLPSARLFTDLDQLDIGDIFMLSVLGETHTYEIDQIRIVLPEEVEELEIADGEDYCTLITCTPYGVNTHRMLVRGRRTENAEEVVVIRKEAVRVPVSIVIPVIGVPILVLIMGVVLIYHRVKRPKKDEKEILEDLKNR